MKMQPKIVENEDMERAATIPIDFLRISVEDAENGGRDSALIVTREDVLILKRYESYGLNLPRTLKAVELQLGIVSSGLPGLEPSDILKTHSAVNLHALSWAPIEAKIKEIGYGLDLFAATFYAEGQAILNAIEKMDAAAWIRTRIDQLTWKMIDEVLPAPLNDTDRATTAVLSTYLTSMAERIEHHKREATSLKGQLTVFVTTIQTQLIPDVHQKLALAKKNDLEQQLKDLATEIDSLSKEIGQKNNEYTQAMNSIAWGLVGGLVGVAITGSIFGSKAEQIRKEKNQLIDLKRHKVEELNTKQPISAAIRRLEVQFEDMHMRLTDALQSASNMETLWSMLAHYVKVSAENLEQITDNQGLLAFKLRFGPVIIPWDLIGGYTKQLVEVFDSAIEQYKLEQRKS